MIDIVDLHEQAMDKYDRSFAVTGDARSSLLSEALQLEVQVVNNAMQNRLNDLTIYAYANSAASIAYRLHSFSEAIDILEKARKSISDPQRIERISVDLAQIIWAKDSEQNNNRIIDQAHLLLGFGGRSTERNGWVSYKPAYQRIDVFNTLVGHALDCLQGLSYSENLSTRSRRSRIEPWISPSTTGNYLLALRYGYEAGNLSLFDGDFISKSIEIATSVASFAQESNIDGMLTVLNNRQEYLLPMARLAAKMFPDGSKIDKVDLDTILSRSRRHVRLLELKKSIDKGLINNLMDSTASGEIIEAKGTLRRAVRSATGNEITLESENSQRFVIDIGDAREIVREHYDELVTLQIRKKRRATNKYVLVAIDADE